MKKIAIVLAFIALGCKKDIKQSDISYLNGFWQIQKVELPSGEERQYNETEALDYFSIGTNLKGFRKKAIPQIDGNYMTNSVFEQISVSITDGKATVHYKTKYASWSEKIIELDSLNMVVENKNQLRYYYIRKQ